MLRKLAIVLSIACSVLQVQQGQASEKVGVVLIHGKAGTPEHMGSLAVDLVDAGYLVTMPEMPWSAQRRYDRSLSEAHGEIDSQIAVLRAQGAEKIVIAGHSMGANMAMGYAATHGDRVHALIALGPGQTVESNNFVDALGSSVAQARRMLEEGRGDELVTFDDMHLGKLGKVNTSARIYLSYFDPQGLANMPATASRLDMPFLWAVGRADRNMLVRGRTYAFDHAGPTPWNRYVEVDADHIRSALSAGQLA
ncbi:MAG TPA: alpha/beta hydrolase [Magnetospirillum sp.]|jgi:pimeloyl-ACP methyl ester carboxylesterase|nr:alpha/beta hydrolase [Magnetospirillum sp.]